MNRKKRYGVWNTKKKEFQFGICEPSKTKAREKLFEKIGKDAYKYRFQIKELKLGNPKAEKLLTIEIGGDNMTNADRIRAMSDEKLAEWLTNMCNIERHEEPYKSIYNLDTGKEEEIHDSYGDLLKWLQSEADRRKYEQ